jgi:DNA (cytosine-5)-methyltransferase 1
MNELALFAGAGGGILGGKLLGWRTIGAVESDPFAIAVLQARQRDGSLESFPFWPDIRTFDARPLRGLVDVVSAGFPCQSYSSASRGRTVADDLWPEARRVVADAAPWIVFAENTQRRAIDRAADDLEEMGYSVLCMSLSASDLGADHIRKRYWLLAHSDLHGELLKSLDAEMAELPSIRPSVWETEPYEPRVANGVADRMDRIDAIGNGQVPLVAAAAFAGLVQAHADRIRR